MTDAAEMIYEGDEAYSQLDFMTHGMGSQLLNTNLAMLSLYYTGATGMEIQYVNTANLRVKVDPVSNNVLSGDIEVWLGMKPFSKTRQSPPNGQIIPNNYHTATNKDFNVLSHMKYNLMIVEHKVIGMQYVGSC